MRLSQPQVGLFATPWIVAPQALPSMGFSRQEYWKKKKGKKKKKRILEWVAISFSRAPGSRSQTQHEPEADMQTQNQLVGNQKEFFNFLKTVGKT